MKKFFTRTKHNTQTELKPNVNDSWQQVLEDKDKNNIKTPENNLIEEDLYSDNNNQVNETNEDRLLEQPLYKTSIPQEEIQPEEQSALKKNLSVAISTAKETFDVGLKLMDHANDKIKQFTNKPSNNEEVGEEDSNKMNDTQKNSEINKSELEKVINKIVEEKINNINNAKFSDNQLIFIANELAKNKNFILEIMKLLQNDILTHTRKIIDSNMADVISNTKKIIEDQNQAEQKFNEVNREIEDNLSTKQAKIENLNIDINLLQVQKEELDKTILNEEKTLNNLFKTCDELSNKRNILNQELKLLPQQIEEQKKEANNLESKIFESNEKLNLLKYNYEDLQNNYKKIVESLENLKIEKEQKIKQLDTELKLIKDETLNTIGNDIVSNITESLKTSIEGILNPMVRNLVTESTDTIKKLVNQKMSEYNSQQNK